MTSLVPVRVPLVICCGAQEVGGLVEINDLERMGTTSGVIRIVGMVVKTVKIIASISWMPQFCILQGYQV